VSSSGRTSNGDNTVASSPAELSIEALPPPRETWALVGTRVEFAGALEAAGACCAYEVAAAQMAAAKANAAASLRRDRGEESWFMGYVGAGWMCRTNPARQCDYALRRLASGDEGRPQRWNQGRCGQVSRLSRHAGAWNARRLIGPVQNVIKRLDGAQESTPGPEYAN